MAKKNSFDQQVAAVLAQIDSQSGTRALPTWLPDWIVAYGIGVALSALKNIAKTPAAKATMKNVFLKLHDGILTAYADDEDFACHE